MNMPITPRQANLIYNVLLNAGATEHWREDFVYHMGTNCHEYRFGGTLGFGGKFYNTNGKWYISCYPEDRTQDREQTILDINERLGRLYEAEGAS